MEPVSPPLAPLLGRLEREAREAGSVFGQPLRAAWRGPGRGIELGRDLHGRRAATVLGAAVHTPGPLAPEIVRASLAGARVVELEALLLPGGPRSARHRGDGLAPASKPRDIAVECAKAALLLAALEPLGLLGGLDQSLPGDHHFELFLDTDLAVMESDEAATLLSTLLDAGVLLDRLLASLPSELSHLRDLPVRPRLIDGVTISAARGSPAHELEPIARHLLEDLGVDVTLELSPMLLGAGTVQEILRTRLEHPELEPSQDAHAGEPGWDDTLSLIDRLRRIAGERGRTLGVKLTDTLAVRRRDGAAEGEALRLGGRPLHALAAQLLARLRAAIPAIGSAGEGPVAFSFSAGIDGHNLPLAVAADLCPVFAEAGPSKLPSHLSALETSMSAVGARELESFVLRAHGEAERAMKPLVPVIRHEAQRYDLTGLDGLEAQLMLAAERVALGGRGLSVAEALASVGLAGPLAALAQGLWVHHAGTLNALHLAEAALLDPADRRAPGEG